MHVQTIRDQTRKLEITYKNILVRKKTITMIYGIPGFIYVIN